MPDPADEARGDERVDVRREAQTRPRRRCRARRSRAAWACGRTGRPASRRVSEPSHRAVERRGHRDAVHAGAQSPERLDRLLRAGDDDGVEAKQESGEGGSDGPEQDAGTCHGVGVRWQPRRWRHTSSGRTLESSAALEGERCSGRKQAGMLSVRYLACQPDVKLSRPVKATWACLDVQRVVATLTVGVIAASRRHRSTGVPPT